jgi:aspartate carbamoyltransferase catalytic subunit
MNHLLTSIQFNSIELTQIFERAKEMEEILKEGKANIAKGKLMATLFFEPSTRTRLSFEAAMFRLGGEVITAADWQNTSLKKGDNFHDTAKVVSKYADLITIRTAQADDLEQFIEGAEVPVINGGDGTNDHPTQTILDLYTVWKERRALYPNGVSGSGGPLDGATFGIMGDCKNSRVLRGMAKAASEFDVKIIFIAPTELKPNSDIEDFLDKREVEYHGVSDLNEVVANLDVLQVNRVRHEYFEDKKRAEEIQGQFIIKKESLKNAKEELILLDPLPRINTVLREVDELPQAKYFDAVENSIPVRMALICKMLDL